MDYCLVDARIDENVRLNELRIRGRGRGRILRTTVSPRKNEPPVSMPASPVRIPGRGRTRSRGIGRTILFEVSTVVGVAGRGRGQHNLGDYTNMQENVYEEPSGECLNDGNKENCSNSKPVDSVIKPIEPNVCAPLQPKVLKPPSSNIVKTARNPEMAKQSGFSNMVTDDWDEDDAFSDYKERERNYFETHKAPRYFYD